MYAIGFRVAAVGKYYVCKMFGISWGGQFNRNLKFRALVLAQVKDEVKNAFRKVPDRAKVKAWVKAWIKAVQNVY